MYYVTFVFKLMHFCVPCAVSLPPCHLLRECAFGLHESALAKAPQDLGHGPVVGLHRFLHVRRRCLPLSLFRWLLRVTLLQEVKRAKVFAGGLALQEVEERLLFSRVQREVEEMLEFTVLEAGLEEGLEEGTAVGGRSAVKRQGAPVVLHREPNYGLGPLMVPPNQARPPSAQVLEDKVLARLREKAVDEELVVPVCEVGVPDERAGDDVEGVLWSALVQEPESLHELEDGWDQAYATGQVDEPRVQGGQVQPHIKAHLWAYVGVRKSTLESL